MNKRLESLAILGAVVFGWTKLGLGAALKNIIPPRDYPPKTETGYLTFDEFLAQVCPACSQLDYEDWLKGQ